MDYSWKYFIKVNHTKTASVWQASCVGIRPYFGNKLKTLAIYWVWLCAVAVSFKSEVYLYLASSQVSALV